MRQRVRCAGLAGESRIESINNKWSPQGDWPFLSQAHPLRDAAQAAAPAICVDALTVLGDARLHLVNLLA